MINRLSSLVDEIEKAEVNRTLGSLSFTVYQGVKYFEFKHLPNDTVALSPNVMKKLRELIKETKELKNGNT